MRRAVFFALAVLCHLGACYEFINYPMRTRDYGPGANVAWVLLLALAVIFWVLRARIRDTQEDGED